MSSKNNYIINKLVSKIFILFILFHIIIFSVRISYMDKNFNTYPSSSHPEDTSLWQNTEKKYIIWDLMDSEGPGYYRILKNGTIIINWTPWPAGWEDDHKVQINCSINTSIIGTYEYLLEFNDSDGNLGNDTVIIYIVNSSYPISNHPQDITIPEGDTVTIGWNLIDQQGPGKFRILRNGTPVPNWDWQDWKNFDYTTGSIITFTETLDKPGLYVYKIEFNDSDGNYGRADIVVVKVNLREYETLFDWEKVKLIYGIGVIFIMLIIGPILLALINDLIKKHHKKFHDEFS